MVNVFFGQCNPICDKVSLVAVQEPYLVDRVTIRRVKMLQPQKCTFWAKRNRKLKKYIIFTFHDFLPHFFC